MHEIHTHQRAKRDLLRIWLYSAERWGAERADLYLDDLNRAIVRLKLNPLLGSDCTEVRKHYRRLLVGRHHVYYQALGNVVHITRILHVSMDPAPQLDE